MKRAREDSISGPQSKRPASVSGESSEPVHSNSGPPRLTTDDALQYLQAVKERFKGDNEKYAEFLEIMKDFKGQRIDTNGVIGRVKDLFKGHNKLIMGFNAFLPKGYEITLPEEQPRKQPVEFDQAINFVNKIKNRFQENEKVYKAFLEILNKYRTGNKSIGDVYHEVAALFEDHFDLLNEFVCFLPETQPAAAAVQASKLAANSSYKKDEKQRLSQPDRITKKERASGGDRDLERKMEKEQRRRDRDRRDDYKEDKDFDRDELDGAQRLPHKRKSARRADELIRKQSQIAEGGNIQKEFAYFEKVKGRLRNRESYNELIKCLNLYNEQIINRAELQSLVTGILGKYPDLLEGFNELLVRFENGGDMDMGDGPPLKTPKLEKERDKDNDRERDGKEKERDRDRKEKDKDRDKERDREKERERDRSYPAKDSNHKMSLLGSKDKYLNKPISELDLSNCERCTPSYRLLPRNYPRPISSHRTQLANDVLNDNWVSVTSGSEDYSFKHMRRNQYEESLFRCEDDRFELDMLLESTINAAKHVGELVDKLSEPNKQETPIRVDDYLSAITMRCIERIYGDHGLDIIDLMRKNPAVALPVVHSRLKQKEEEWSKCRSDMNKVWAEVYSKNYHKSLDHRSFYFKQQDKKSLSTRGLLSEIKDIHEKKRKENDSIMFAAMGNRRLVPDMNFAYADRSIHEDLFQIMKYSADEVCNTMEQSDKIMRVWTTFLESMFGVPSRSHATEDTEEAAPPTTTTTTTAAAAALTTTSTKVKDSDVKDRRFSVESSASPASHSPENAPTQLNQAVDRKSAAATADANTMEKQDETGVLCEGMNSKSCSPMKDTVTSEAVTHSTTGEAGLKVEKSVFEEVAVVTETLTAVDKVVEAVSLKNEREEGELSPSPEIDRGNEESFPPPPPLEQQQQSSKKKGIGRRDVEYDEAEGDVDEHEGDEDGEESAQKSNEESENPSEAEEEGSASESGDDVSREEDEEDEEDKHESECEGEGEGMADADDDEDDDGDGDGEGEGVGDGLSMLASSDRSSILCKPLAAHITFVDLPNSSSSLSKDSTIFYGNDLFYILFRLHQTLYERILSAKANARSAEQKWRVTKDTPPPNLYDKFVRVLYNLLDGSADNVKFEDECRAIIGTQSYVLFTLDKLIFKLVKQLQAVAADEAAIKLLGLNAYEKCRTSEGFTDLVYHANTCVLLHDENIYRFEHRMGCNDLLVQLMDGGSEKLEVPANAMEFSFSNYLSDFLLLVPGVKRKHNVFLQRNKVKLVKPDEDECEALLNAMKNVKVINGLEYKISCKTSKVSYVLDTEDLFHRSRKHQQQHHHLESQSQNSSPGQSQSQSQRQSKGLSTKRLHDWIDKELKKMDLV